MAKKTKNNATPIDDYSMTKEYERTKLPTGEYSGIPPKDLAGVPDTPTVAFPLESRADLADEFAARDPDLDPQYIWRGKNKSDLNELEVKAPVIYQQEKIFPRMLIEDLRKRTAKRKLDEYRHDRSVDGSGYQATFDDWSSDFAPDAEASFYTHNEGWKNRMILGDSLQVMASLAENEQLRGKVQAIYFDPPYGIKFNSNWQPTTKSTNVKDGSKDDITREPEMVKAFRDTWHDGIHSYLGYLRDRLTVARDLLADSGSVFVQIGDANVHKVRAVMDEVFGEENFISLVTFKKTSPLGSAGLAATSDYLLWFAKEKSHYKYRKLFEEKTIGSGSMYKMLEFEDGSVRFMSHDEQSNPSLIPEAAKAYRLDKLFSAGYTQSCMYDIDFHGKTYKAKRKSWSTNWVGMQKVIKAGRVVSTGESINFKRFHNDFSVQEITNLWSDTSGAKDITYVCQTSNEVIKRCLLMTTDPGDLVLDPTCGSGTTAYVAEQWGRRWITIDTSRVALALARQRLMTAKFPYYLLADSPEGLKKEMEVTGKAIVRETYGKVSQGFVYERVPHITLKAIANDAEIDVIWEKYEAQSKSLRDSLAQVIGKREEGKGLEEWQVPFDAPRDWSAEAKKLHAEFMKLKRSRQAEIDQSIARVAETEYLYDKPYEDKKRVRVAGPFTVESVAPVRALVARDDGEPVDPVQLGRRDIDYGHGSNYIRNMLEALRKTGVKQSRKADRIVFSSVEPFAGRHVVAEGWTDPGDDPNAKSRRVAIAFGPEFGSVTRLEMNACAKEARECGFDLLLVCAFNFEAYVEEGSGNAVGMKTLLARMNADLHMSTDLKETGSGNPFVIFGEPDIEIRKTDDGEITVEIKGVDVYDPRRGEVRSDDADAIDCWMLDTDYNEEAFFARQVYFPGKNDVYKAFKTFLRDDIDEEEWETVAKTVSRPFPRPQSGLLAVKVINHFGDEVMKVFHV